VMSRKAIFHLLLIQFRRSSFPFFHGGGSEDQRARRSRHLERQKYSRRLWKRVHRLNNLGTLGLGKSSELISITSFRTLPVK
jgi:hypothetical protein